MNSLKELKVIWKKIPTNLNIKNNSFSIEVYKDVIDIFQVGRYIYYVVDVRNSCFDMVATEVTEILGYSKEQITIPFYVGLIHPDDLPYFLNFEKRVEEFFAGCTEEDIFRYKVQYDFRLRKADGTYIKMLHQFVVIQHDPDNVRTFAIDTDITNLKRENTPVLSFIGLEGLPSYYNVSVKNSYRKDKEIFTRREKEILRALAKGLNSQEIADYLSISKFTVDSHRKNMLKKTAAKTTNEVIRLAFDNGWI